MKKYIKSSFDKIELPSIKIEIEVEFFVKSNITASTDNPQNLPIADSHERREVCDIYASYMQSIINVIEGLGFTEMERKKSPRGRSQTSYYVFCYENEFYVQHVEFVFTLRVSNHQLPMRDEDRTQSDANRRQERYYRNHIQQYKWLSDSDEDLELVPTYVTYEGDYVEKFGEILRDVKRRLIRVKADFPSSLDE